MKYIVGLFKKISVNRQFAIIYVLIAAVLVINISAVTITYQQNKVIANKKSTRINEIIQFTNFRSQLFEANLAAMDAIVDASSGKVAAEVKQGLYEFQDNYPKLATAFKEAASDINRKNLGEDVAQSAKTLIEKSVALINLIEAKKYNEKTGAEFDDAIDKNAQESLKNVQIVLEDLHKDYGLLDEKIKKADVMLWLLSVSMTSLGLFAILFIGWPVLRAIVGPLTESVSDLKLATGSINSIKSQIDVNSVELSKVSGHQHQALIETQESVTKLEKSLNVAQTKIAEVLKFVMESKEFSSLGKAQLLELAQSMKSLESSRGKMESILEEIKNISNKTSDIHEVVTKTLMLSFNASIEAARAGAEGKGFAVVAAEVGRLADMSGKVADDIDSLLNQSEVSVKDTVIDIGSKMETAYAISEKTGELFEKLISLVSSVHQEMEVLNLGIGEQTQSIQQVKSKMGGLQSATQQSSRMSEELKTIAVEMQKNAKGLEAVTQKTSTMVLGNNEKAA